VTPYIPQKWYRDAASVPKPMWSARWGHALSVFNETSFNRNDLRVEENSDRAKITESKLVLLGGDDYDTQVNQDMLGVVGEVIIIT